ncbi:MAG: hypothetical protein K5779_00960 [Saccharofermentans sp.]|nr:hypothetical protein [Saccharofermentans sp.]
MRRLRLIVAAVMAIAVCIACFTGCKPAADTKDTEATDEKTLSEAQQALKPVTMIKLGNHTYYPDYLFARRNIDVDPEEYVISCLEEADKSLDEDIYIWGISVSENAGATRAAAMVLRDGILLTHQELWFDYGLDKTDRVWHDYGQADYNPPDVQLVPEEVIISAAYEAADKHRSAMRGSGIDGTYVICADYSGNFYYDFTVNICSKIKIDACTGEILDENYWDGRYT